MKGTECERSVWAIVVYSTNLAIKGYTLETNRRMQRQHHYNPLNTTLGEFGDFEGD